MIFSSLAFSLAKRDDLVTQAIDGFKTAVGSLPTGLVLPNVDPDFILSMLPYDSNDLPTFPFPSEIWPNGLPIPTELANQGKVLENNAQVINGNIPAGILPNIIQDGVNQFINGATSTRAVAYNHTYISSVPMEYGTYVPLGSSAHENPFVFLVVFGVVFLH